MKRQLSFEDVGRVEVAEPEVAEEEAKIPEGWVSIRVGDAGRVQLGRQRSPEHHVGPDMRPYLRVANVFEDRIDTSDVMQMNFSQEEFEKYRLIPGDILLNEGQSRELVGRPALFRGEIEDACFTNSLVRFQAGPGLIPKFALAVFRHFLHSGQFQLISKWTTNIAHLGAERFAGMQMPMPPLPEQHRIVAKLDALSEKSRRAREALDEVPELLEKLRQSILAAAFRGDLTAEWRASNPQVEPASELLKRIRAERRKRWEEAELAKMRAKGKTPRDDKWKEKYREPEPVDASKLPELPEGWCWARVEEVGSVQLGRQRSPEHHNGPNMRPYLRVANVFEARIDVTDVMEMDFSPEVYERYRLAYGDILLNEGQSRELVGRPAMFRGELPDACFTNSLVRFQAGAYLVPEYALIVFRHFLHSGAFQSIAKWTTNIAHLGAERFASMPMPIAPIEEQKEIADRVETLLRRVESTTERSAEVTRTLKEIDRSVLAKAFRGELVPQDPNDEPASVMLARLREERAAAAPTKTRVRRRARRAQ